MTEREKLLETLKVAYEPRKIPQDDGSVALFYPTDEDVADMIEAAVIDKYKHRAEVAERALRNLAQLCAKGAKYYLQSDKAVKERERELYNEWIKQAEKELAEEKKE